MNARTEHAQLDKRSRILFKALVERYIRFGQPVGSRTLARAANLDVSAATVRNVMADLEDWGFVASPHTSAGRVPTVRGYRYFVDSLLSPQPLGAAELVDIERQLIDQGLQGGQLLESASKVLSSLSDMAGVVTVPRADTARLRQIEFLPLSDKRILAILVVNRREVQNRIIQLDQECSASELEQVANYLNARFAGTPLAEIRSALVQDVQEARTDMNRGLADTLNIARRLFGDRETGGRRDYVLAGQTNLMSFPEFSQVERLRSLFDALQQKRDLLALFDDCLSAEGVQIFIGEESGYRVLDECSVVSAPYTLDGEVVGILGVIGPTRMAYSRIIPLVDATASLLGSALKTEN